jgi:hypothetical protein
MLTTSLEHYMKYEPIQKLAKQGFLSSPTSMGMTCSNHTAYQDTLLPHVENSRSEAASARRKPRMEATETQANTMEVQIIKSLWIALQVAERQTEKRGLQFGQAMYEYREKYSAQGRRTDLVSKSEESETRLETFEALCDRLSIPRATAYRWIAKYEESIGTRLPKPNPDNRSSETTSYDVKAESEPIAQPTTITVVTREEQDKDSLGYLVKRLTSLSLTLQQLVDDKVKDKPRWSKYHGEYAELVSIGKKVAGLVELL